MKVFLVLLLAISLTGNIVQFSKNLKLKAHLSFDHTVIKANKMVIDVYKKELKQKSKVVIQKEKCIIPIEDIKKVEDIGELSDLSYLTKDRCEGYGEETFKDCVSEIKEELNERREFIRNQ